MLPSFLRAWVHIRGLLRRRDIAPTWSTEQHRCAPSSECQRIALSQLLAQERVVVSVTRINATGLTNYQTLTRIFYKHQCD